MKYFFFNIILLAFFISFSCRNADTKQAIHRVDSMLAVVDSLKISLKDFPMDSVRMVLHESKDFNGFVKRNSKKMPHKLYSLEMESSGLTQKFFGKFPPKLSAYSKELEICKEQLADLKYDLEENLVTDSLIPKYLDEEKIALAAVRGKMETEMNFARQRINKFVQIKPILQHLRDSIE
jgi:hypothetical protein